jgi:SAM-dependent methyltransferase
LADGDAQWLKGVPDAQYDFVHSSHCLEHLHDPIIGLRNWFRVLKPGGHLIVMVPDEDLYEMGFFPSRVNGDHKWTFSMWKEASWSPRSINVIDLVKVLGAEAQIVKLELLDAGHRYRLPSIDQTLIPTGECAIEMVIRKRPEQELVDKGRLPASNSITADHFFALTGIQVVNVGSSNEQGSKS